MAAIVEIAVRSQGRIRLTYDDGAVVQDRLKRRAPELKRLILLNPLLLPAGTVIALEGGRVVSNNRLGATKGGRKPLGDKAMSDAERQRRYRERHRKGAKS